MRRREEKEGGGGERSSLGEGRPDRFKAGSRLDRMPNASYGHWAGVTVGRIF